MRSPIPKAIREELAEDPYMKKCALQDSYCSGRVEWHHAFTYAGKRVNELWSIIPLCHEHHADVSNRNWAYFVTGQVKERIRHFNAFEEFAQKYPRSNLLPTLKVDIIKR